MYIPKSLFSWTVVIQVTFILAILAVLGFRRFCPTGPTERATRGARRSVAVNPPSLPVLGRPGILVDKSERSLTVYDGSRPVAVFPAAVGAAAGDKRREGDRRTPEGRFYVCLKNPESKYVLSLGLSYPGIEDARRGLRDGLISAGEYDAIVSAVRAGKPPPWNTALGGEIMIHGKRNGGRGTLGCVALEDEAIRTLYPRIPVGTPVLIRR